VLSSGEGALGRVDLPVDVPVEEVEVEVLEAEVLEGVLDGERDVLRVVVELEELGGDPELVTGDASLGDALTDLGLVAVSPRAVDVLVAVLESVLDGLGDLALGGLPLLCEAGEAEGWGRGEMGRVGR
jgi:hypothetical protein